MSFNFLSSRSRDSTFSQSSDTSNSPSLNQRPRAPPDFTSRDRLHMPSRSTASTTPYAADLVPPTRPFGNTPASNRSSLTSLSAGSQKGDDKITTSLSVNYLPSKFSRPHSPGLHPRRTASNQKLNGKNAIRGGGIAAFRTGENRMPGANDDDYDGVQVSGWGTMGGKGHRLRWNRFKWILFCMNCFVSALQQPPALTLVYSSHSRRDYSSPPTPWSPLFSVS